MHETNQLISSSMFLIILKPTQTYAQKSDTWNKLNLIESKNLFSEI